MRGRLELTIPPCIESSYLLASDTPTKRLTAMQRQVCGGVKTASRFLTAHTLCLLWPLPCRTEPLRALSQAARDGDRQFCRRCFPHALHSEERGCLIETNYYYKPILVAKSNQQKGGGGIMSSEYGICVSMRWHIHVCLTKRLERPVLLGLLLLLMSGMPTVMCIDMMPSLWISPSASDRKTPQWSITGISRIH